MKNLYLFLLCGLMCAANVCAQSGTTGPLSWSIADGVLTISGTGAMPDYSYNNAPWEPYQSSITSVVVGDSVTSIGSYAFSHCENLTSVTTFRP
jgi:hypothetical protein